MNLSQHRPCPVRCSASQGSYANGNDDAQSQIKGKHPVFFNLHYLWSRGYHRVDVQRAMNPTEEDFPVIAKFGAGGARAKGKEHIIIFLGVCIKFRA